MKLSNIQQYKIWCLTLYINKSVCRLLRKSSDIISFKAGHLMRKLPYILVGCVCVSQAPQPLQCGVCLQVVRRDSLLALPCQHSFCKACWEQHCIVLVKDGIGVGE